MMRSEIEHWFEELQVQVTDIYRRLDRLQTLEDAMAQNYGWIGGAWQKDPLLIGYSGDVTDSASNLNASAGTNTLLGTQVPAGEIWIVQIVNAYNNTTNPTDIFLRAVVNGVNMSLNRTSSPGAGTEAYWTGSIVLSEGDRVGAIFSGCIAGDDLYLSAHAVRVDIDQ